MPLKIRRFSSEVNAAAAQAAMELPHVFRVYTREQLIGGSVAGDRIGRQVLNGFYLQRSGDANPGDDSDGLRPS